MEIIAFDSFKGCITSSEAGEAFAQGRRAKRHETRVLAMSDGGDGMHLTQLAYYRILSKINSELSYLKPTDIS